jgi:hypothetical protein
MPKLDTSQYGGLKYNKRMLFQNMTVFQSFGCEREVLQHYNMPRSYKNKFQYTCVHCLYHYFV